MPNKQKKFADDGWAIWIDGDDTTTVYINDWLNPKGQSYVDLSVRIRGVKASRAMHVYVPFAFTKDQVQDVSLNFQDKKILQAIFSTACIIDYKKNDHTSEVAYNGKTVDIVHISTLDYQLKPVAQGTLISVDLQALQQFIDNDEAYFIWRMPHKSLDEIFNQRTDMKKTMTRLRDLITTPVLTEKYGYSIRINEARLLPEEITRSGAFHRQKLKKAVITLSIDESYELNDGGCYRIRRLEEDLYKDYMPKDYNGQDVITYQWSQNQEYNLHGQFNFYYNISKNSISGGSMLVYIILLLTVGVLGEFLTDWIKLLIEVLKK